MITADQLLAHAVGDYIMQSDWMANEKTKKRLACWAHALTYMLCFLPLTQNPATLFVICVTHFAIDHYRLARYVCWLKNFLSPPMDIVEKVSETQTNHYKQWNYPWSECIGTGYHKDRPAWLAVWLMIIADNTMHIAINGAAIMWLG